MKLNEASYPKKVPQYYDGTGGALRLDEDAVASDFGCMKVFH
jgi:hypothetical protein